MNEKILCVDDDPKLLKGLDRQLGDRFELQTAVGPLEGLEAIRNDGPFAVVVSDMRMPEMDGVEFLRRTCELAPDTVRIMLTGFADLNTATAAVNQGYIFRFLAKPCAEEDLVQALTDGIRQYRLIRAEKELVEGTLRGSIQVLSSVLSLVNPLAFGQASRVRQTANALARRLALDELWQLDIAALLSSLGCVTIPQETLQRKLEGQPLSSDEEVLFDRHSSVAADLLKSIPRMETVAQIIACQSRPWKGDGTDMKSGVPYAARVLRVANDFDWEANLSESPLHAVNRLKERHGEYDPRVVDALADYVRSELNLESVELTLVQLEIGMVLAADVFTVDGKLLISKGHEIFPSAKQLLMNFARASMIKEPIRVVVTANQLVGA